MNFRKDYTYKVELGLKATAKTFHILNAVATRLFHGPTYEDYDFVEEDGKYYIGCDYPATNDLRSWVAKQTKKMAHEEVGSGGWFRINQLELDTFGHGITVEDVYCAYDAMMNRKNRSQESVASEIRLD